MQNQSQRFDFLRAEIVKTLQVESKNTEVSEKILVFDDHYIGHRFRSNGYQVDWLFEGDQIIARQPDGQRCGQIEMALAAHIQQRKAA